jgi:hypothetical protein
MLERSLLQYNVRYAVCHVVPNSNSLRTRLTPRHDVQVPHDKTVSLFQAVENNDRSRRSWSKRQRLKMEPRLAVYGLAVGLGRVTKVRGRAEAALQRGTCGAALIAELSRRLPIHMTWWRLSASVVSAC